MIKFRNTYKQLPDLFYERIKPEPFERPELIAFNDELAIELELKLNDLKKNELAEIFSGKKLLPGSDPIALAYAGMQFGHAVPQLGDGRAHLLGEVKGFDIQLKGSGQTKFSRRGDGRSALGPVLREYIVSEAMYALGVPTTRALCAVSTGEQVCRQFGPEPGGIFTRVASSHLRVGTFQYFAFQNDYDSVKTILDYTLKRHYPELLRIDEVSDRSIGFLQVLIDRQSDLIAKWSGVGFIHGVMNTDNFSIAGITIDYGPCAFMDEFDHQKVFSSIDRHKRYAFWNQVPIASWNILRLAECLLPFIHSDKRKAIDRIEKEVVPLLNRFEEKRLRTFALKLGIKDYQKGDAKLVQLFLQYLEKNKLDFTLSFRNLGKLYKGDFSFYKASNELDDFVSSWKKRNPSIDSLNGVNPYLIPRNHQVQKVIDDAYEGDYVSFHKTT